MADAAASAVPSRSDLLRRGTELLAAEDRAPALFLSGPAGIGKSWLAEQIVAALLDDAVVGRDVAVVRAIATPSAASIPFGAFAHLLADEPVESTRTLEPPGLLDALRSVRRRLLEHRGGRTLVIVVDDAHGLDDPSATVVRQLTATGDATALVTVRAGEPLPAPVRALRADPGVVEIEIAPMTVEEVNRLAHAMLGRWLERPSLHHLHHLSEGNPLFARELLADAAAEDRLTVRRGLVRLTGGSASTRLVALVSRDLDRVSAAAADLVDAIAVGEPLPVGVARRLADLATLADLEGRGIISVNRFGDQQVRLSHPLFGEVRRARLGPLRRAHLAERLARAFDAAGLDHADDALRVVNWRLEAGEVVEAATLFGAAHRARALGDEVLAERLVRTALDVAPTAEAELLLAEVLEATGGATEAARRLDGLPERLTSDADRARALTCQLRVLALGLGRLDAAEATLVDVPRVGDPTWRGFVLAQWATLLTMFGRVDDGAAVVAPLVAHADDRVRLRALPAANLVSFCSGRLEEALDRAQSLVGPALELHHEVPSGMSVVFSALLLDLLALGRTDDVDGLLALAQDPSAGTGANQAFLRFAEGTVALRRGQVATARRLLHEALAGFDEHDPQGFRPAALGLLTQAAALGGDREAARQAEQECRAALRSRPSRLVDFDTRRVLAWAGVADGDPLAARRALTRVAADARAAGHPVFEAEALHDAARLGAGTRSLRRLRAVAQGIDGARARAMVDHAAARSSGDPTALDAASVTFERLGELLVAAELAADAARAHQSQGVATAARRAAGRSRMLADRCPGALLRIDVGPPSGALTPRELQVARLAAAGSTNPQIASRLGVSARTVGNQLGRVYDKLGVAGRTGLAEALARVETASPGGDDTRPHG